VRERDSHSAKPLVLKRFLPVVEQLCSSWDSSLGLVQKSRAQLNAKSAAAAPAGECEG